ncbi:hypothetical protein SAMN04487886_103429 [Clostridium sp. DSM 8431]|uniref:hypothetical protein n=1 Tax=Clostridium sp. DSM 8431 TaxID=1761781 RepID=UPI0008F17500|nr:hypothetical protein [Clostridium sp. DSM 8431]SFU46730.1 hypothetical protein SAMN04487886_103429 [Clostridium sp. DSM 8431]
MKATITFKQKIRAVYILALSVIVALIIASNISLIYFSNITINRLVISSILLTISGVVLSIPVYITNNVLKDVKAQNFKGANILLNIAGTGLFMILIYLLFAIYTFISFIPFR